MQDDVNTLQMCQPRLLHCCLVLFITFMFLLHFVVGISVAIIFA